MRSFDGCWTCRLRRKKCDETHPICDGCASLLITCHYGQLKPEWMDGGLKQEEMADKLKREIKENAHSRRSERVVQGFNDHVFAAADTNAVSSVSLQAFPRYLDGASDQVATISSDVRADGIGPFPEPSIKGLQGRSYCTLRRRYGHEDGASTHTNTVLLMFYFEDLFPAMFSFYRPSALEGGRSWILDMITNSPVVRQVALCHSSYFFALARAVADNNILLKTMLAQTGDAFAMLRQALQTISDSNIIEHLHGAVRIMASMMLVQRFEIAIVGFDNCRTHLNAALALFKQILASGGTTELACSRSCFNTVLSRLGSSALSLPTECIQVPGAEQAAFRFSTALLLFDDIIASTVLQEQPNLYEYLYSLLQAIDGEASPINLEVTVGCQNWVLLQIGEVAALDAWKQRCKRAGTLDVMELVHRATAIKTSLETQLTRLHSDRLMVRTDGMSMLDVLGADFSQQCQISSRRSSLVTRVWAHAAIIYLAVVVSGWQPASVNIRYHVGRIIELLTGQTLPPTLLRTMVWPFCVAGCLAEPAQDAQFRAMVATLRPANSSCTVSKALEIMENVWRDRDVSDVASRDLAMCFRSQDALILLL